MRLSRLGLAAILLAMLAGCVPGSGPSSHAIVSDASATVSTAKAAITRYALVDLDAAVIADIPDESPGSIYKSFGGGKGPAPTILVGVGDTIRLTIFESRSGGLFVPSEAGARPGNYVTLPSQTIARDGIINVPYAGPISVSGRSTTDIENEIAFKLADRAIEPQVIVDIVNQSSAQVTVTGSVGSPTSFTVNPSGERILDAISRAGGIAAAPYETYVSLRRNGKQATVYFNTLVTDLGENIYVAPGDTIYVYSETPTYTAFGATSGLGQFPFGTENLNLIQAVGKAGGLSDGQAEPRRVFIYRIEKRSTLEQMEADLGRFPPGDDNIPTIYRADLRDPSGFFVAQMFKMRDKDIIYASNADYVEFSKFASMLSTVTGTPNTVVGNVNSLKYTIRDLPN